MTNKEMAYFLSELRNRHEMPIDENEYYLLGDIADHLMEEVDIPVGEAVQILELLKEQEPALPTWSQGKAYCGKCGQRFPRKSADMEINYCSYCGRSVKWE